MTGDRSRLAAVTALFGLALVADGAAGGRIATRVGSRWLVGLAGLCLLAVSLSGRGDRSA